MRLTDTLSVEWDGSCYVLTETLRTTKRKGAGEGEREQRRYFTSLYGALKRSLELCPKDAATLEAAVLEQRKMLETIKGLTLAIIRGPVA